MIVFLLALIAGSVLTISFTLLIINDKLADILDQLKKK